MKKHFFVVAAVIISSQLSAQDTTGKELDEAVITANKFEQKQSQTGKVISVITKEQIEKSSGKTLVQLLNEQAGITINGAYNVNGSVQTLFMRGGSSGRTLILLDGIPVNDPSMINNEFDLNLFSINDVEKIEICRGAQSTLYGSDAIAGAINIITVKKELNTPFNAKATIGLGNKNTIRNNIQLYGKVGKLTYITRFAKLQTDGFSSAFDSTKSNDFDKDGYDGNIMNTSIQYQVNSSLSIKTFIQYSQYKADIDAAGFKDEKDYSINNSNFLSGTGFNFKRGIVNVSGNYQYGELKRAYRNDSLFVQPFGTIFEKNRYGGRTQYVELFGNVEATKWLTVLSGFDYRWTNMNQQYYSLSGFGPYSSSFDDTSLHQISFYSSLLINGLKKKLNIEIGARLNKHSRYGTNSTFTFNPSYNINNNLRVFGSIASGFKAPSIFQVYDDFSGNLDLKAEKSINYELGLQQGHGKISSRIVYFQREIKNGIDYNYTTFQYFNFVKQNVSGLELELSLKPSSRLNITANYTFIKGIEKTQSRKNFNDTSYNHLLRRPKHNVNMNIGYQFCKSFFASISAKSVGKRYDAGGYRQDDFLLENYFILSAYSEYKLKNNLKFFIDIQNITNKQFYDIRGYNAIPIMINGGVTIQL